jgi:hypothetical protein
LGDGGRMDRKNKEVEADEKEALKKRLILNCG